MDQAHRDTLIEELALLRGLKGRAQKARRKEIIDELSAPVPEPVEEAPPESE